jgi:hypothetical protein
VATYKRIIGDSLWIDIQCDSITTIDPTTNTWPANWKGYWKISSTIGGTALCEGNTTDLKSITKSTTSGLFQLRLGPLTTGVTAWKDLTAGTYFLTIQIDNSQTADFVANVNYRHEEQHKVVLSAQGITP